LALINIIRLIKSKTVWWERHVALGREKIHRGLGYGNLKARDHLGDLALVG